MLERERDEAEAVRRKERAKRVIEAEAVLTGQTGGAGPAHHTPRGRQILHKDTECRKEREWESKRGWRAEAATLTPRPNLTLQMGDVRGPRVSTGGGVFQGVRQRLFTEQLLGRGRRARRPPNKYGRE